MTASGSNPPDGDRWVRGLHNLYLVTLLIGLVASVASVTVPAPLSKPLLWSVTALAIALLAAADLAVRRLSATSGGQAWIATYFLATGAVLGALTAVLPAFAIVAFGVLPLAFVMLRRPAAVIVGVVVTGSPYVFRPYAVRWLSSDGTTSQMFVRFGAVYSVMVGIALPVMIGLFTAAVIGALSATRGQLAAASRLAGRAEERQRLAHELHDTMAQGLSGVVLQLEAAEQQLGLGPPYDMRLQRLLGQARQNARRCLADTRRAVEALRPEPLDEAGLAQAVKQVCRLWTEATGVRAHLVVRGQSRGCHPRLEVAALRVVQEALANAGKHAAATEVAVTLEYRADEVRLNVTDDGRGFDPEHPPSPNGHTSGGLGLATIRERVTTLGGTVDISSAPGTGTTITATLPDLVPSPSAAGALP